MARHLSLVLATLCAVAAMPAIANAHALLKKAIPAVGSTIATSPREIRINFSEGVEPSFSGIALTSQAGVSMPVGKSRVDPSDEATLILPVSGSLKPGTYTVGWHALAIDGHKTQGTFQFTVQP